MSEYIYLYLKTHNKTGLKYLGKTTRKDVSKYKGSGTDWKKHVKENGYDVTTEILFRTKDKNEFMKVALYYSKLFDVVDSTNFANLKPESGDGGGIYGKLNGMWGKTHTKRVRNYLSKINKGKVNVIDENGNVIKIDKNDERFLSGKLTAESKGRIWSQKSKQKLIGKYSGNKNPRAKRVGIYNSEGELVYDCFGNYLQTIKENKLPMAAFLKSLYNNTGVYYNTPQRYIPERYKAFKDWKLKYIEENKYD